MKPFKTQAYINSLNRGKLTSTEMDEITVLAEICNNLYKVDYRGVTCTAIISHTGIKQTRFSWLIFSNILLKASAIRSVLPTFLPHLIQNQLMRNCKHRKAMDFLTGFGKGGCRRIGHTAKTHLAKDSEKTRFAADLSYPRMARFTCCYYADDVYGRLPK